MLPTLFLVAVLLASLLTPRVVVGSTAQASCSFSLGFKQLRDQIPRVVGDCLEDEHFNLENGNSEQQTTGGLLVWRKADNWTAFTDAKTTWINGPYGLQSRPNNKWFDWESAPVIEKPAAQRAALNPGVTVPPPPRVGTQIRPRPGQRFDSALKSALNLLVANSARFTGGKRIGPLYRDVLENFQPDIVVGESESGDESAYVSAGRTVEIGEAFLEEDPRVLASVLAHELMHAQQDYVNRWQGAYGRDCVRSEVEAYAAEAEVWGSYWGGNQGPSRTPTEVFLNYLLDVLQATGKEGLTAMIEGAAVYQHLCRV